MSGDARGIYVSRIFDETLVAALEKISEMNDSGVKLAGSNNEVVVKSGLVSLSTALDKELDSLDVGKMSPGGVSTPPSLQGLVATTTSAEINCFGYNALIVEAIVSGITSGNWVIECEGTLLSGATVGQYVLCTPGITPALKEKHLSPALDANGTYILIFKGVAPFNKLTCSRTTDGTLSVRVMPINL